MHMTAAAQRIVYDGGDHMSGGWWWVMGIGWLVFLGLIVVLAVVLVRHYSPAAGGARRSVQNTLDERFARGEIDEDDYRRRRDALRG
jgi:putative membrane protein